MRRPPITRRGAFYASALTPPRTSVQTSAQTQNSTQKSTRASVPTSTWTTACAAALTITLSSVSGLAHAGGFSLIEHGASGLGNAYAGAAAVSADASILYFNPAGMLNLADRQLLVGAHLIGTNTTIRNENSTLNTALGGSQISGDDVGTNDGITPIPNIYFVSPLGERMAYGISLDVPYGSGSDYGNTWFGRYTATESSLSIIEINPSFAYQLSDQIQLGVGINFQIANATLANAVDSGAVCFAFANGNINNEANCVNAGLTPGNQATDSLASIEGDSTGLGFNLGAIYSPIDGTRIGISYRHSVDHTLEGTGTFTNSPEFQGLLDAAGSQLFQSGPGTTDISTPATVSLSASHRLSQFDRLELLADATWTQWTSFDELLIQFDSDQPDVRQVQDWRDVWRVSAGLNFQYSPRVVLRAGFAIDESPIPGPTRRTPRIPGNDRTWYSVGVGYQQSESLSFDVGFTHIAIDDTPIDNNFPESGPSAAFLRGVVESSANIVSAQLNWKF